MASKAAVRPLASLSRAIGSAPRRQFATHPSPSQRITTRRQPEIQRQVALRQGFRRSYADQAPVKPKRRAGFFRWAWRLTYLSALGGLAWVGYGIYLERNPSEQDPPDPKKKTLVVLGMLMV